jgi:uncharacterized protein (DUF983 family)
MTKNQARFKSILTHSCPKCLSAKMYKESNPYKFSTMTKMHERCPSCNEPFYPEPGFYFGAMYVTYGMIAGEFIAFFAIKNLLGLDLTLVQFILVALGILFVLAPLNFRFSRVIWLNFFVSYDETKAKNKV